MCLLLNISLCIGHTFFLCSNLPLGTFFFLTIMQINNRKGADMCNYFFFFFLRDFIMVVVFSLTVSFDNTRTFLLLFMDDINHLLRDCQSWKIKAFAHMKRILPFHKNVGATFLYSTWFLTRRRWWTNTSFSLSPVRKFLSVS